MINNQFSSEIRKTGFVLENQVAQQLKSGGWSTISNKYYIDDSEKSVREIDLLAYRVTKVQHFDVYTVLLISCKKSESNVWTFLARDINVNDPNTDWWPFHGWSNDKALAFQLSIAGKGRRFHDEARSNGVEDALKLPDVEIFALQELDKVTGKPQNDKPIFSAVTSLIKAQAYELSVLPNRKKSPSVYQFNLISIVDAKLVRLMFRDTDILPTEISSEHYFSRFIVQKKESFSRIRFINSNAFNDSLNDYALLHKSNCKWFGEEMVNFYSSVLTDGASIAVFLEEFKKRITWVIEWRVESDFQEKIKLENIALSWDKKYHCLNIALDLTDEVIQFLNINERVVQTVTSALKEIYRYEGKFKFELDIPF